MASTRLPGKCMLPLADGRPILAHVVERAVAAFGREHVVVATTTEVSNDPIRAWCAANDTDCFSWNGPEEDVLSRFWHCAHARRWHPDSVIVRVTADDPFKSPDAMRRVAAGERLPVEVGGEAFTLAMLHDAFVRYGGIPCGCRPGHGGKPCPATEHLTLALYNTAPPPCPPGTWTVDTRADYEAAVERSRVEMLAEQEMFG